MSLANKEILSEKSAFWAFFLEKYTQQIAAEDVDQKEVDQNVEEQIEELHGGNS